MLERKPLDWTKNLTVYEVNIRQYSQEGTFKAVENDIPRLKDLGVGIIWLMPIQPIGEKNRKGSLGSYYSISDYRGINPEFGTKRDLKSLIRTIHKNDMYVIIDWVANHTAWDHVWGEKHPEYYTKDANGNFVAPYPEWADVMHLNYDNKALWKAMAGEMKYWIKECDIDGFRCDMAHLVRTEFWEYARTELEAVKPMFMLAETENKDLLNSAFDMIYNWRLFHVFNRIAKQENCVWDIDNCLNEEITNFPNNRYQLFFTSNHDENTWQGSAIERLTYGLETINVLTFTIDGMPLIYNGQEAGNAVRLSFFEKDCIDWKEDKMFPFYQKLIELRKRNMAIWSGPYGGKLQRVYTDNNHSVFAFIRQKDEHKVLVILNLSYYEHQFALHGELYTGQYTDVFTDEKINIDADFKITLAPWGYKVYEAI